MHKDEKVLWQTDGTPAHRCVMVSCCSGAELQLWTEGELRLRELYPDRSTLYERAGELRTQLVQLGGCPPG